MTRTAYRKTKLSKIQENFENSSLCMYLYLMFEILQVQAFGDLEFRPKTSASISQNKILNIKTIEINN